LQLLGEDEETEEESEFESETEYTEAHSEVDSAWTYGSEMTTGTESWLPADRFEAHGLPASHYRTVAPCRVRGDFDVTSPVMGTLGVGEVLEVLEGRMSDTGMRIRFARQTVPYGGWVSVRAGTGVQLLQPVASDGSDLPEWATDEEDDDAETEFSTGEEEWRLFTPNTADGFEDSCQRYTVLEPLVVREDFDISSAFVSTLSAGEVVECLETQLNAQGIMRIKCCVGWLSEFAGDGTRLVREGTEWFKVVSEAVLRTGRELSSYRIEGNLQPGEVVEALEVYRIDSETASESGLLRVRLNRGWTSVHAGNGATLLVPLSAEEREVQEAAKKLLHEQQYGPQPQRPQQPDKPLQKWRVRVEAEQQARQLVLRQIDEETRWLARVAEARMTAPTMNAVAKWLDDSALSHFQGRFESAGYDDLELIRELDAVGIETLIGEVAMDMKRGHILKLRIALGELTGAASLIVAISTANVPHVSECVKVPQTGQICTIDEIARCEGRVVQVAVDGKVLGCAELLCQERDLMSTNHLSTDSLKSSFEALWQCASIGNPAHFADWAQYTPTVEMGDDSVVQTPASVSLSFLDFPVLYRDVAWAASPCDRALLKFLEEVGHSRFDAGTTYTTAVTAYVDTGCDRATWLAATAQNSWPATSTTPMPYVQRERLRYLEVARVPWSDTDHMGASVHAIPSIDVPASTGQETQTDAESSASETQHLLVVYGDPRVLLQRCTHTLVQGHAQMLSATQRDAILATVESMSTATMVNGSSQSTRVFGFAKRILPIDQALSSDALLAKVPDTLDASQVPKRQISQDEHSFPLHNLTYIGHVAITLSAAYVPATTEELAVVERRLLKRSQAAALAATRAQEEQDQQTVTETQQLVAEAKRKLADKSQVALERAARAEKRASEEAIEQRTAAENTTKIVALAEAAESKASQAVRM
jgi:hypothetical protein